MEQNQLDGTQTTGTTAPADDGRVKAMNPALAAPYGGENASTGGTLTAGTAAVSQAYPNADPAQVARNTLEINGAVAEAAKPKLVRHLMQQRIDEAQFEVDRLTEQLKVASPALLDLPLADAMKIFG